MTKNPLINALTALLYITAVASFMFYAPTLLKLPKEDSVFMPIWFISLFVFSAATMGYVFLSKPIMMFLEGEKQGAVKLFLHTVLAFGLSALALAIVGYFLTAGNVI